MLNEPRPKSPARRAAAAAPRRPSVRALYATWRVRGSKSPETDDNWTVQAWKPEEGPCGGNFMPLSEICAVCLQDAEAQRERLSAEYPECRVTVRPLTEVAWWQISRLNARSIAEAKCQIEYALMRERFQDGSCF